MALCDGDIDKVAELVRIFIAATLEDVKAMDRAADAGDLVTLRQMAHRLASACQQLDETEAVTAMRAIESLEGGGGSVVDTGRALYGPAREELNSVLARASDFVVCR